MCQSKPVSGIKPATPRRVCAIEALEQRALLSAAPSNTLDVTTFGVVGDGKSDDYAALNTAIAAAQSARMGLYFPNGTYIYNRGMNAQGVPFYGQSQQAILVDPSRSEHNLEFAQDITFQDFPIRDYGCSLSLSFNDCRFVSTVPDATHYMVMSGFYTHGEDVRYIGCTFVYDTIFTALYIVNYDSVVVQNCTFNPDGAGYTWHNIFLAAPNVRDAAVQILGNTIYGGATGIFVGANRQMPLENGLIEGNRCYQQREESISLDGFGNNAFLVPVIANGRISTVTNDSAGRLVVGADDMLYVTGNGLEPAPVSLRDDWTNFYFSFGQGSGFGGTLAHIVSFDPAANTLTLDMVAPASTVTVGGDAGVQAGFFNWTIKNNYVHGTLGTNNTYGTAISAYLNAFGTTIEDNVIDDCAHGINLAGGLMLSGYYALAYDNVVRHNTLTNCDQYGAGVPSEEVGVIRAPSYWGGRLQYNNQFIDNTIEGGRVFLQEQAGFVWQGNVLQDVRVRIDQMSPVLDCVVEDGQALPDSVDHLSVHFVGPVDLQSMIDDGSIVQAVSLVRELGDGQQQAVAVAASDFSYDPTSEMLRWQLPAGQSLPTGGYELRIDSVRDSDGNSLACNFTATFRSAKVSYGGTAWVSVPTVFRASPSDDGTQYTWDFGDQTSASGADVKHQYRSAGTYTMTVTAIDGHGSRQRSMAVEVTKEPTTTSVTTNCDSPGYGQPVTFTATVTPVGGGVETGAIQFKVDGSSVGNPIPVKSNTAAFTTCSLAAGTHTVVAAYLGDGSFAGSTSRAVTQVVPPLPSWVSGKSRATWNGRTHTLTVTGPTTIIADPGANVEPQIIASGPKATVAITTAGPSEVHVAGITLTNGASIVMTKLAGRTSKYNVLTIGATGAASDPIFRVDAASKVVLASNHLIVHAATCDSADRAKLLTVQALAATGANVAIQGSLKQYVDRQWTQVVGPRLRRGFFLASVELLDAKAPDQPLRLSFASLPSHHAPR